MKRPLLRKHLVTSTDRCKLLIVQQPGFIIRGDRQAEITVSVSSSSYADRSSIAIVISSPHSNPSFRSLSANTIMDLLKSWPVNVDKPNPESIPFPRLPRTLRAYSSRTLRTNRGVIVAIGTVSIKPTNIICHPTSEKFPQAYSVLMMFHPSMLSRKVTVRACLIEQRGGGGRDGDEDVQKEVEDTLHHKQVDELVEVPLLCSLVHSKRLPCKSDDY